MDITERLNAPDDSRRERVEILDKLQDSIPQLVPQSTWAALWLADIEKLNFLADLAGKNAILAYNALIGIDKFEPHKQCTQVFFSLDR